MNLYLCPCGNYHDELVCKYTDEPFQFVQAISSEGWITCDLCLRWFRKTDSTPFETWNGTMDECPACARKPLRAKCRGCGEADWDFMFKVVKKTPYLILRECHCGSRDIRETNEPEPVSSRTLVEAPDPFNQCHLPAGYHWLDLHETVQPGDICWYRDKWFATHCSLHGRPVDKCYRGVARPR